MFSQRLYPTAQFAGQIAAASGCQLHLLAQLTVELQRHRPSLLLGRRQLQLSAQLQRPVAGGLHLALQRHLQIGVSQAEVVNLNTLCSPARGQLQALQLFDAIKLQAVDLHLPQLQRQRQAQVRQTERLPAGLFIVREDQADRPAAQLLDTQRQA